MRLKKFLTCANFEKKKVWQSLCRANRKQLKPDQIPWTLKNKVLRIKNKHIVKFYSCLCFFYTKVSRFCNQTPPMWRAGSLQSLEGIPLPFCSLKAFLLLLMCCRQALVWMEPQLSGLCGEAGFLQHDGPAARGAAVSGSAGSQLALEAR